jgi:sulfatase modifying factor 1
MKFRTPLLLILIMVSTTRIHAAVNIQTVAVGNAGNPGYGIENFGAVSYEYVIGKYEVTNAQYSEFLNAVDLSGTNSLSLYSSLMTSHVRGGINFDAGAPEGLKYVSKLGRENNPVVFVSWYDAARFTNWLHNGQGTGSTETGAYTLLGGTAVPSNELTIVRNQNARWFLPTENEWYKAAYHANDGLTGNYWNYAFGTHATPYSDQPPGLDAPDPSKTGNFLEDDYSNNGYSDGYAVTGTTVGEPINYTTDVGAYYLSTSPYGTYDQAGNVHEWNETLIRSNEGFTNPYYRGWRGGSWISSAFGTSRFVRPLLVYPSSDIDGVVGFRVAGPIVPEPCTCALIALGTPYFLMRRRWQLLSDGS